MAGMDCSDKPPTKKQLDYAAELSRRVAHKIQPNEVCCRRHTSLLIETLVKKRKPFGWDRRSRAGNKRYRQGYGGRS